MAPPVVQMSAQQYTWILAVTTMFAFLDGYSIGECDSSCRKCMIAAYGNVT